MPRFHYSVHGIMGVAGFLAASFLLIGAACKWDNLAFALFGVLMLVVTLGWSIGYLVAAERGAIIGVIVFILLLGVYGHFYGNLP